ncbi:hypothetical protein [Haloechinothrix halophila]|uniref:hypothetical protein n=1 Tax=Haloechinothrix halophila TaxID=1069073 RepID=UPI000428305C|nr:hypothetical protein [Haloechinothrix halophila]
MGWFRRFRRQPEIIDERPGEPEQVAREFWQRWHELLPDISAALGDREPQRFEHDLTEAVAAMHPDLQFSVDRGQRAIYSLVVTGQEDPALRPYTDAWLAAAPHEDAIWEYHDSVPPVPDPSEVTVNLGAHQIALADVRIVAQVDEASGAVDVAVHHPELAELEPRAREALTFLPLDATLGERLAARWLGRVETADNAPENAITLLDLRELVHSLDAGTAGEGEAVGGAG